MAEIVNAPVPNEQKQPKIKQADPKLKIMEQRLDGIMFHIFYKDLFELLDLKGLEKFHLKQKELEENSLNCLKSHYIKCNHKLPILNPATINYHDLYSDINMDNMTNEKKAEIVKQSLEHYYKWEIAALKFFTSMNEIDVAKEVIKEVEKIENIINLMNTYGYTYDNVLYMSNYLL